MLKINKKMEYALMSLKYMSALPPGQAISVREICERFQAPFDTVSKIMQTLQIKNIVTSIKGTNGGYRLISNLEHINFVQLENIVEKRENNDENGPCHSDRGPCSHISHCNIVSPITLINSRILSYLKSISLKDLFEDNQEKILQTPLAKNKTTDQML